VANSYSNKPELHKVGFQGVQEFLICFDMACLDTVLVQKGLDEAHYRQIMNEPEWLQTKIGQSVCQTLA